MGVLKDNRILNALDFVKETGDKDRQLDALLEALKVRRKVFSKSSFHQTIVKLLNG